MLDQRVTSLRIQDKILSIQYQFYKKIYSIPDGFGYTPDFMNQLEFNKILEEDKIMLDEEITEQEVIIAIKEMELDKVSASRWNSIEFYRFFFKKLKKILVEVIKEMSKEGLSIDQSRGVISLMDKPQRNLLKIDNWRLCHY